MNSGWIHAKPRAAGALAPAGDGGWDSIPTQPEVFANRATASVARLRVDSTSMHPSEEGREQRVLLLEERLRQMFRLVSGLPFRRAACCAETSAC
jgi:hypothetical protein